jgi:hypothetical protein
MAPSSLSGTMSRIEGARVCRKMRCQQQFGRPTLASSTFEHIAAFFLPRIMHIVGNRRMPTSFGTIVSRTRCPDRGRLQPDVDQPDTYCVIGALIPLELISDIFPTRGNHICPVLAHSALVISARGGDQVTARERGVGDEGSISIERVECSTASSASAAHVRQAVRSQITAIDRQKEFRLASCCDTNRDGISLGVVFVNNKRNGDLQSKSEFGGADCLPSPLKPAIVRNSDGAREQNAISKGFASTNWRSQTRRMTEGRDLPYDRPHPEQAGGGIWDADGDDQRS